MPTPTKRVRKRETPAEAKTRLIKTRRRSVSQRLSWTRQFEKLETKLRKKIRGGRIQISNPTKGEFDFQADLYGPNQRLIGFAGVNIKVEQQKLGLYVETLQGKREKDNLEYFTEVKNPEINEFKKRNGKAWNLALAQELVDAAYKAGFDRILLSDVRTKFFYKKDYLLENYKQYLERRAGKEGKTVDKLIKEMQKRMEAIYDRTATELGMRKVKGYWVLEFP